MKASFPTALAALLKHEGGYADHPSDPGGATNMGITRATLASWRKVSPVTALPKSEVQNLTLEEAGRIYKTNYWDKLQGDRLPAGVDYAVFDYGVNSGPARAAKALQQALGQGTDGVIGPLTIKAANAADAADTIGKLSALRMAFLTKLPTFATFGRGWTRRVDDVRKAAIAMAAVPLPEAPPPPDVEPIDTPAQMPRTGQGLPGWMVALIWLVVAVALIGAAFFVRF